MKTQILLSVAWLLLAPGQTKAQQPDSLNVAVPSSWYLDIATLVLEGNGSINYEAPLSKHTLLRVGCGYGYLLGIDNEGTATSLGLLTMVNFLTSGSNYRFEFGAGGSINRITSSNNWFRGSETPQWRAYPAVVLGYRYHPYSGGSVFRVGLGFTYAFGTPLYVSFGVSL
jgi:hypothetical protein